MGQILIENAKLVNLTEFFACGLIVLPGRLKLDKN